MAKNSQPEGVGLRCVWGIFLLVVLCPILGMSLFSYDWRDVSVLQVPTNDPPANLIGPVGAWLSFGLFMFFGVGAYVFPFWCLAFGSLLVFSREERVWPRGLWSVALVLAAVCIMDLHEEWWAPRCAKLNIVDTGGMFGRVLMRGMLVKWFRVGAGLLAWGVLLCSFVMFVGLGNLKKLGILLLVLGRWLYEKGKAWMETRGDKREQIEKEERQIEKRRKRLEKAMRKQERARIKEIESSRPRRERERPAAKPSEKPPAKPKEREEPSPRKLVAQKTPPPEEEAAGVDKLPVEEPVRKRKRDDTPYELPPMALLNEVPTDKKGFKADTGTTSTILTETLAEFGIEAEVTDFQEGPVVTRYELLPAPGIRVERIAGLSNNLALALKATSVRVQAPIPGKGVVGIEVPNTIAQLVCVREVLESDIWVSGEAWLPLALGKDVGGNVIVGDLTEMPHLLIAGATGSGKTVCMNSILAGLLMSKTPDDMRLMLVDPKIVEFSVYNHLPHLVVPVVTNPKKVALGLRWAINEMEKRYKLFAKVGVRNIASYNSREIATQEDLFADQDQPAQGVAQPPATLPYIVIVIDELADLMLADGPEIENCIARLAQLSRAVGIHMIIATQRPSVNVITGTIKANFPARIAFQVAQKVDSRTILDSAGADKLLGRGDMLYQPPGTSKLVRAQGAMATDKEIQKITRHAKEQAEPEYEKEIQDKIEKKAGPGSVDDGGEDDELIGQAVEIIRETQRASTSSLQRRLRIGYTRAARIMDILEERGIIGPPRGSDPREILIDLDGEIPNNAAEPEDEEEAAPFDEETDITNEADEEFENREQQHVPG